MARNENTNQNGGAWTDQQKKNTWKKGQVISGEEADTWRKDKCGKKMKYSEHGNRKSDYGWEIDHINPVANGGNDNDDNLQPLHWKNNVDKADKTNWNCPN